MKHGNLIVETRPVGPFAMNSYLVGCERTGEAAIIDSGGDGDRMLRLAEKHGLTVNKLLQTHAHIDHIAGLGEMKQLTSAPIYLHPADEPIYTTASMQAMMFGLRVANPPPYDEKLADGDVVCVGELRFEVLHTPGHCPGLVCFYEPQAGVVFCGDLVFKGSIGRVDLPGASPAQMWASLTRFLEVLDDGVVVYPGHMESTTVGQERRSNPFLVGLAS